MVIGATPNRRQPITFLTSNRERDPRRLVAKWLCPLADCAPPPVRGEGVRPESGQFAFEAFDLKPQHATAGEQQQHLAARLLARVKLQPEQGQRRSDAAISISRDRHDSTRSEPQRRDQPARLALAGEDFLAIRTAHADDETILGRTPQDVARNHRSILDMRGDHREIVLVESGQLALSDLALRHFVLRHGPSLPDVTH